MGDLGYDYSGCHVVVTGGSRGVGLAIARAFAEFGADVTVTGTHFVAAYYSADLTGLSYRQLELSDPDQIRAFVQHTPQVDVLVNAASARLPGSAVGSERDFVLQATQLGLAGTLALATKLRGRLASSRIRGGGSVIELPAARRWHELYAPLTPAQHAADVRRHAAAFAHHGVRFNAINALPHLDQPATPTNLCQDPLSQQGPSAWGSGFGGTVTALAGNSRTRAREQERLDTEMAAVSLFLASSGAAGLTGQTVDVHGGIGQI
ncbi:MAG: SDR family oxidoreductase [Nocardioides sp.]